MSAKWRQLHFRVEGAEGGSLSALLRDVADRMDTFDDIRVLDMTMRTVLTEDAEFKQIVDVYYSLDSDVSVSGEIPAGSNIVYHGSQANPSGKGSQGVVDLLKKFADGTVAGLGDVAIETIVFKPPLDEETADEIGPSMIVYYTDSR
ncbi:hypothetical protein [Nocardia callitridis]|uniref:Uncharacterized protein n=1 Tax=Nocardia callitridis TaxID=648753 RepID=A0ABP9L1U1_9NOCA